jgi:hypothetical protein
MPVLGTNPPFSYRASGNGIDHKTVMDDTVGEVSRLWATTWVTLLQSVKTAALTARCAGEPGLQIVL